MHVLNWMLAPCSLELDTPTHHHTFPPYNVYTNSGFSLSVKSNHS
jgi:hypothetical protein